MEQMIKIKKGTHLTEDERKRIAVLHKEGYSPYKIGKILNRASNTIRNELKRGTTVVIVGYFEKKEYFPDTGQAVYEKNRSRCRSPKKIETCSRFINFVEDEVLQKKRSFASARMKAINEGAFDESETCSVCTLYKYTEMGLLKIKNIDLPEKVSRKHRGYGKDRSHKRLQGVSIEERPERINNREEFGHWEIDLVIGKKEGKDNVLLTLTERKTRMEIVRKIKGKTIEAVHRFIKKLRKDTPFFDRIFKSITTDNGSEFAQLWKLGKSLGIDIYYAHPYSSWERGLNENTNRIVRRFVRKGTAIKNYTRTQIAEVERWINTMYRKVLGWRTAEECFREEVEKLIKEEIC